MQPDPYPDASRTVREIVREAGHAILEIYRRGDADARSKDDGSPLTEADLASHRVLSHGLHAAFPDVPVVSEESAQRPAAERTSWRRHWLVDPLDGTKEFLKRNGEFTVNVALIEDGRPVLGVVHVPVTGVTYGGRRGIGAWREDERGEQEIRTRAPEGGAARVVASRSHSNPATQAFVTGLEAIFDRVDLASSGSSLKLCRVAEGAAHYYPRLGPTMEWDTAAAHAVVEAAGGAVWRYGSREPLRYGKDDLLNPPFLVVHDTDARLPHEYDAHDAPDAPAPEAPA